MNKICTYVGTTICTILFFLTASYSQPVVSNITFRYDTACSETDVTYAPLSISGGSGTYHAVWTSTNPNDQLNVSAVSQPTVVHVLGKGNRTINVNVIDDITGLQSGPLPVGQIWVKDTVIGGWLNTDSTYRNEIRFVYDVSSDPQFTWNHYFSWSEGQSTALNSMSGNLQIHYATVNPIFHAGNYTLTITDYNTGCQRQLSTYFDGINHPVVGPGPVQMELSATQVAEFSIVAVFDFLDVDPGTIFINSYITNPQLGTITENTTTGNYTYSPHGTCGIDSFVVIACDQSEFLPATTCDTVNVIITLPCEFNLSYAINSPQCFGGYDGNAAVIINDTTIDLTEVEYLWSTGNTTGSISGSAGAYYITVTHGGLHIEDTVIITDIEPLHFELVEMNNILCGGMANGSIRLQGAGGTPPYQYSYAFGDLDFTSNYQ